MCSFQILPHLIISIGLIISFMLLYLQIIMPALGQTFSILQLAQALMDFFLTPYSVALFLLACHYALFNHLLICYAYLSEIAWLNQNLSTILNHRKALSYWMIVRWLSHHRVHHNRMVQFVLHYNRMYSRSMYSYVMNNFLFNVYVLCFVLNRSKDISTEGLIVAHLAVSGQIYGLFGGNVSTAYLNSALLSSGKYFPRLQMLLTTGWVTQHLVMEKLKLSTSFELVCNGNRRPGLTVGPFGRVNKKSLIEVRANASIII